MRTSTWLLQSSWWVLATEICPSQLWTSRWLARSSSPTQMKMKTGTGEWSYCCIVSIVICDTFGLFVFNMICLCGECERQTWSFIGLKQLFSVNSRWQLASVNSLATGRCKWHTGGIFLYCRWLFWNHLEVAQTHSQSLLSQQIPASYEHWFVWGTQKTWLPNTTKYITLLNMSFCINYLYALSLIMICVFRKTDHILVTD